MLSAHHSAQLFKSSKRVKSLIINIGSVNIDHVYKLRSFPLPGETVTTNSYSKHLGGKGINQTIALYRGGAQCLHYGKVGRDTWLVEKLETIGLDISCIDITDEPTGHAIIYVDENAENNIVVNPGANYSFTKHEVARKLRERGNGNTWVVLQNETNIAREAAVEAKNQGFSVCYSAAPFSFTEVESLLGYIDLLALNESEYEQLQKSTGVDPTELSLSNCMVLITLGAKGAKLYINGECIHQPGFSVNGVDTTGAGDTFLGSFLAQIDLGRGIPAALEYAAAASAIQVTRAGSSAAIPFSIEVYEFIMNAGSMRQ